MQTCKITGANTVLSTEALALDNSDFEDSLQYVCARSEGCDVIISNDKRFYQGEIDVLNSDIFIDNY